MTTAIHRQVEACRAGIEPRCVCRVQSGWVVLGPVQFLRGYSLLLPDPVAGHLNDLPVARRTRVLEDAALLGDGLLELTGAVRINYEILGNLEPALHIHLFPRFNDEPADLRTRPVWFYDWDAAPPFDPGRDTPLKEALRSWLVAAGAAVR